MIAIHYVYAIDGESRETHSLSGTDLDYHHGRGKALAWLQSTPISRSRSLLCRYSGGYVLVVGAIDRRVKCVVAQVPLISGDANARRLIRADYIAGLHTMFDSDRRARMQGKSPAMILVVSEVTPPPRRPCPRQTPWHGSPRPGAAALHHGATR